MKIRKIDIVFVLVGIIVVVVLFLAPPQTTPKFPNDATHAGLTVEKDCQSCHGPGKIRPFPEKHPKKDRCFFCHKKK